MQAWTQQHTSDNNSIGDVQLLCDSVTALRHQYGAGSADGTNGIQERLSVICYTIPDCSKVLSQKCQEA